MSTALSANAVDGRPIENGRVCNSKFAVRKLLGLMLCLAFPAALNPQEVVFPTPIRVETVLVNVPAIVTDSRGMHIPGLKKEDFRLYEDGSPQPISIFAASEEPVNVALLLDTSKSTVTVLERIKKAARGFLGSMRPRDRALLISFDLDVKVLYPLSDDVKDLDETVKGVKPGDYVGTKLRDAVLEVTANRFKSITGRKAIILLSDGQDFGSRASVADLLASVAESGVLVYSVFYKVDIRALSRELFGVPIPGQLQDSIWQQREREAAAFLQELSELSAGRFMPSEISNLHKTFAQIIEELRHQYLLGFYPEMAKLDGSPHTLNVVVEREGAVVRARHDYRVLRQNEGKGF